MDDGKLVSGCVLVGGGGDDDAMEEKEEKCNRTHLTVMIASIGPLEKIRVALFSWKFMYFPCLVFHFHENTLKLCFLSVLFL